MIHRIAGPLALLVAAATVCAQTETVTSRPTIDSAWLTRAGARAVAGVETELAIDIGDAVEFRITTPDEIEAILDRELRSQFAAQFPDPATAEQQRGLFCSQLAPSLMAKFVFDGRDVLVAPTTIDTFARLLEMPELGSRDCVQAMLVHEVVHVASDLKFGWTKQLDALSNTDAILAYNAITEGHAQFVARKVCAQLGWTEAFELFTSSIGRVPEVESEVRSFLLRNQAIAASWAYHDGERFIAAIHAAGGDAAIERAYRAPPDSPAVIFHPEWFLDPASRPEEVFEFDGALNQFTGKFSSDDWIKALVTLTTPQLESALSLLPTADVDRFVLHLRSNKMAVLNWAEPLGEHVISAGLFEFDSHAEAAYFFACEERLLRLKDEKMRAGETRISASRYVDRSAGETLIVFADKTVISGPLEFPVATVVLARGAVVAEITYSNRAAEEDELVSIGTKLLDRAMRPKGK